MASHNKLEEEINRNRPDSCQAELKAAAVQNENYMRRASFVYGGYSLL